MAGHPLTLLTFEKTNFLQFNEVNFQFNVPQCPVPEIIDPVFAQNQPKRSFSIK